MAGSGVVLALEHPQRSVAAVRHVERVVRRHVTHALRSLEPGDGANELMPGEINDAEGIILELGHEQPLALQIDRHMVDAPGDLSQRDFRLDL